MNLYLQLSILLQINGIVYATFVNEYYTAEFYDTGEGAWEGGTQDHGSWKARYCENIYARARMDPNASPVQAFVFDKDPKAFNELGKCVRRAELLLPRAKTVFWGGEGGECIAYFESYSTEKFNYEGPEDSNLCELHESHTHKGDCVNKYPKARQVRPPYLPANFPSTMKDFQLPLEQGRTLETCISQAEARLPKVKSVFYSPEGECIGYYKNYNERDFVEEGSDGSILCEIPQSISSFREDANWRPTFRLCQSDIFFNQWPTGSTDLRVELPNKAATMEECIQMGHNYEQNTIQAVKWETTGTCIGFHSIDSYIEDNHRLGIGLTGGSEHAVQVTFFCYILDGGTGSVDDPDWIEPTVHPSDIWIVKE